MIETRDHEKYGYSRLRRIEELKEKKQNSDNKEFTYLEFMGKYDSYPVVEVRIEFPVYRLKNGRTRTLQLEYLAKHPEEPDGLFTEDHDSLAAQMAQDEILNQLIKDEGLLQEFTKTAQQTEPIIVTYDGIVVNGNRRLCAWRKLYYSDSDKYKHFQTIRVLVLPQADEQALDDLEEQLQTAKTFRADYSWHAIARRAKEKLEKNPGKESKIAGPLGLKNASELKLLIDAYNYAEQYLESRGKKNYWSEMDGFRYAFEAIVKTRKKINGQELKELFEQLAFQKIDEGSNEGRLYAVIPEIGDNIKDIFLQLSKNVPETLSKNVPEPNEDDRKEGNQEQDEEILDDIDVLSSDGDQDDENKDSGKISEVYSFVENNDNKATTWEIVNSTIDTAKQLKRDKEAANFLLAQVIKAETYLQGAIDNGLIDGDVSTDGINVRLDRIIEQVAIIKEWLKKC